MMIPQATSVDKVFIINENLVIDNVTERDIVVVQNYQLFSILQTAF